MCATGRLETRVEVRRVMLNGYVTLPFKLRANGCNNSQHCWELSSACWQWCAKKCNNSQQRWDLQCIMGRIQPIRLCKPCGMQVRGPKNVERAVQMDPISTLLRYASAITEQKKCWELLDEKPGLTGFKLCATTSNNMQQGGQTDATYNIQ